MRKVCLVLIRIACNWSSHAPLSLKQWFMPYITMNASPKHAHDARIPFPSLTNFMNEKRGTTTHMQCWQRKCEWKKTCYGCCVLRKRSFPQTKTKFPSSQLKGRLDVVFSFFGKFRSSSAGVFWYIFIDFSSLLLFDEWKTIFNSFYDSLELVYHLHACVFFPRFVCLSPLDLWMKRRRKRFAGSWMNVKILAHRQRKKKTVWMKRVNQVLGFYFSVVDKSFSVSIIFYQASS